MLKTLKISRRFALRGALSGIGVALWLPVLEAMCDESGTAFAAGTPLPTSFGIFYWGNGVHFKYWTPSSTGKGDAWSLPTNLASFAPVKDYMTLVTGLNMLDGQFKGHGAGGLYVLAGGDAVNATLTSQIGSGAIPFEEDKSTHGKPTIDQIIADAIGAGSRFKSLETGIVPYTGLNMGTVSKNLAHRGPYDFLQPERDPKKLFDRLFAPSTTPSTPGGPAVSDISGPLRKSALDAVLEDAKRLRMRLGAGDAARLDQHMTSIRAIEQRIQSLSPEGAGDGGAPPAACAAPAVPKDLATMTAKSQIMNKLIATALACNLTRVFSHLWSGARDDNSYPIININPDHHGLTHAGDAENEQAALIEKYIMSQYADLAITMKATPMGASNVLENSLIYGVSEVPNPRNHFHVDYHMVLMGHAAGKLPGNRHLRLVGRKVTELGLQMMQTMGVPISSWGTWDNTSSPMSEILG
jgi:hypothetical protein